MTVNPPQKGASIGPKKMRVAKIVSAVPRVSVSNMSAYTEAVRAIGAEPKTAMKNREIMSVWISLQVAEATAKTLKPNKPMIYGSFLPRNSDIGANRDGPTLYLKRRSGRYERGIGQRTYPAKYREDESTDTSTPTWNFSATAPVFAEKTLDANVEQNVANPVIAAVMTLSRSLQLKGC